MVTAFRWLLRIFGALVALAAISAAGAYYFASRSLPDYSATHEMDGLDASVEIVRDNANVPHIFGESDADVFHALGVAHAQDRLWQMVMLRRTAKGRLSEVFGESTLHTDELMRRLDLSGHARASLEAQDDATRAALSAYARGVNAWIETVNEGALGRGAPEFFLFPGEVSLWEPADSLALIKLMAFRLSGHMSEEVRRARVSMLLEGERVRDILPDAPGSGLGALPDYAALFDGLDRDAAAQLAAQEGGDAQAHDALSPLPEAGLAGASNVWAALPERSAAGGTLMANDPHLGFTAPGIWYLARLELETGGVIGGTIPGIPAVLTGRNAALGWGLTSSYLDDQDVYIEELDPDDPDRYRTPDGWAEFETDRTIIRVDGGDPVTITRRWTENGPVLPGHHADLAAITPSGHATSLAWTGLADDDTTMSAAMAVMRAQSVESAIEAAEGFVAPSHVLALADEDNVALQVIGRNPRRHRDHQTEGRMPSPGWREENRWQGFFDVETNPRFVNPASGIVGNTNNKLVDRPFPNHVSHDWGDTQRIQRWRRLMERREVHTRDSFVEAQLDTVSPAARTLLPLIAAELWHTGEPAAEGSSERMRQRALDLLADWNGDMNEHLPEPLIYATWLRKLQDRLIRDRLGPMAREFRHVDPVFIERVFRDTEGAGQWCDVIQSSSEETCAEQARLALDAALIRLEETYGPNPESWRWGDAHEALHAHETLGEVPLLAPIVNIRHSTSGGDHTLMRGATSGRDPDPFRNVHGAGFRSVIDFNDPDSSVFITATGQSGNPLSRHYDDYAARWRRGEYIPMSLDPELARGGAVGITRLEPAAE